jgi:hypothetical protein
MNEADSLILLVLVEFEVLTAVVMNNSILWDITSCGPYRTLLATCFHSGYLLGLFSDPEDGGDISLRKAC